MVTRFHTRSKDKAAAAVEQLLGLKAVLQDVESDEGLSLTLEEARLGGVKLARIAASGCRVSQALSDGIIVAVPLRGVMEFSSGAETVSLRGNTVGVASRLGELTTFALANATGMMLIIPMRQIVERVDLLTGEKNGRQLLSSPRFLIEAKDDVQAALLRNMNAAFTEISSLDAIGLSALGLAGYEDLLLNLAIAAVFPEVTTHIERPPPHFGPAVVRKARDWIAEHAPEPIEIARIASELGVSMRALQENFKRYYGCSPRDYIIECRLEIARKALLNPHQEVSVTEIALASGFGDLSHFSAKYRDCYGELPSETLRRARF